MAAGEIYAYVVSGVVQQIFYTLPSQFGSVTDFDQLSDADLLTYGFYVYTFVQASYDPLTQELGDMVYTIDTSTVSGTNAVVDLSSDQIAANIAAFILELQSQIIPSQYGTDWISVSDSGLTTDQQTAYTTLRADLLTSYNALSSYTSTQLESLGTALTNASADLVSRLPDFSANITALQTVLTGL